MVRKSHDGITFGRSPAFARYVSSLPDAERQKIETAERLYVRKANRSPWAGVPDRELGSTRHDRRVTAAAPEPEVIRTVDRLECDPDAAEFYSEES